MTRLTYRRAWASATRVVLVVGGVIPVVIWAVVSPWTLAAALAAGLLVWRMGGWNVTVGALGGMWRERVGTGDGVCLPCLGLLAAGFLWSAVGWDALLGGTGTAVVLLDALFGLPLLLVDDAASMPPSERVELPRQVRSVDLVAAMRAAPDVTAGFAAWTGPRTLLSDLSDAELWHAWKASTRALDLEPNPHARLRIVAARSRYLDALTERDPEGLARRLDAAGPSDDDPVV